MDEAADSNLQVDAILPFGLYPVLPEELLDVEMAPRLRLLIRACPVAETEVLRRKLQNEVATRSAAAPTCGSPICHSLQFLERLEDVQNRLLVRANTPIILNNRLELHGTRTVEALSPMFA
eukprot:CAMPEP_0178378838 /NCGR_PEP_ID=MMETSP0689_2-20121128/4631_1 /TAXON_ID=160604 /ORGANISM="Amphidinium massartii, Strain CS-259" /LENGTH=120 /DNA_ID=CAMNT_0019998917 /DNA_START=712 /DNA_END=1070 /DNA_ORIENTATION=+